MPDLKLKKVVIRNWMRYVDTEVVFPDKGLVLVTGVNKASGGKMASVGAGKTAFGEAICRTLLGSKGRFSQPRSYSRDKKGNSYVRVEAERGGVPLIVESGYKAAEFPESSGEGLRYQFGKSPVERSRMDETREEIANIIGVTPALSDWTVFIRGKKIEFSELSQEDAVNLVMSALVQPPWTQFFERSKAVVGTFKNALSNDENNHTSTIEKIKEAKEDVAEAEDDVATCEKVYNDQRAQNDKRIAALEAESEQRKTQIASENKRIAEIAARTKEIEDEKAVQQHALEIERNGIDDKIADATGRRDKAVETRSNAKSALDQAEESLADLKATPKDCPTCGKAWDKANSEDEITKQADKVKKAKKKHEDAAAAVAKVSTEISTLQGQRRDVNGKLSALGAKEEMENLCDECQECERNARTYDRRIHAIELEIIGLKKDVSDANVKAAKVRLEERKKRVTDLNDELQALATSIAENTEALKVVTYWNKAFSPTGIPNMVLSEAIGPMNQVAQTISHRMTGGTIRVTYATSKQLATGASKAELIINVNNDIGSSDIQGSSNGEGGLTNFIVAETLSEIGNVSSRVGFRWYDEVVPYQDPVVAKSIYAYMRETAHRLGILVFLVDHNPVAENYADKILVVEKTRTGTTVAWR
jgi:DNA repair exonuclease SbcCD ATPase subunit